MLNSKQRKLLDYLSAKNCSDLSQEIWIGLNSDNQSPNLEEEVNEYLNKEKNVTENGTDLRHLRKAGRAKKIN